jgi:hypothetical protein
VSISFGANLVNLRLSNTIKFKLTDVINFIAYDLYGMPNSPTIILKDIDKNPIYDIMYIAPPEHYLYSRKFPEIGFDDGIGSETFKFTIGDIFKSKLVDE